MSSPQRTGAIAPNGQQTIAQSNALGSAPSKKNKRQRPERAADYTKGNALREE